MPRSTFTTHLGSGSELCPVDASVFQPALMLSLKLSPSTTASVSMISQISPILFYCSYELHNFFVSGFLAFTLEPLSAVHFQFQPLLAEQKRERIVIISCAIIYLFFT